MPRPHLGFSTELSGEALARLFDQADVRDFLHRVGAGISMAMLDLDPLRAEVIRKLEKAGIEVTAWLLVDEAHGYFLNADNPEQATQRYEQVHAWTQREGLRMRRLGLDIEPPRLHLDRHLHDPLGSLLERFRTRRDVATVHAAERAYAELVARAREHGRSVETYQSPYITDERRAGGTLIRRSTGIVDVRADREALMLYRSHLGAAGVLSYIEDADAITLGVTGGGIYAQDDATEPKIDWPQLREDLLAAARVTREIFVFSLEGCVAQDMLPEIERLDWDARPVAPGASEMERAHFKRSILQSVCRSERFLDRVLPVSEHGARRGTGTPGS